MINEISFGVYFVLRSVSDTIYIVFNFGWDSRVLDGDEYWSNRADKRRRGLETNMSFVWR